jgi:hypothetical protein
MFRKPDKGDLFGSVEGNLQESEADSETVRDDVPLGNLALGFQFLHSTKQ